MNNDSPTYVYSGYNIRDFGQFLSVSIQISLPTWKTNEKKNSSSNPCQSTLTYVNKKTFNQNILSLSIYLSFSLPLSLYIYIYIYIYIYFSSVGWA